MAFINRYSLIVGLILIFSFSALVFAQTYNCEPYTDGSLRKMGDLDRNKVIDINDSRIFFEFMVNNSIISGDKGCLDADGNGIVDFEDNRILNQHIDEGTELGFYNPSNQSAIINATNITENITENVIQEELKKKQESESGGRRRAKTGNNTGGNEIINITDVINKINEIREDSPVLFWSIVSILSVFILAVSIVLIVLFGKMIKNRTSEIEDEFKENYFKVQSN